MWRAFLSDSLMSSDSIGNQMMGRLPGMSYSYSYTSRHFHSYLGDATFPPTNGKDMAKNIAIETSKTIEQTTIALR